MKHLLILSLLLVFHTASAFGSEPTGTDKSTPVVKTGRVQTLATLKLDSKPNDANGVALVQTDGTIFQIVEDKVSRLLFLDPSLHDRSVKLTGTVVSGTKKFTVTTVQTVKDGIVYDVDYWCENCQMSYTEPGKCICCGGDTVLRERPAKK